MITETLQNGMDGGPIFIGGLAHSGKTPLRQMLALHPRLAMTRRTNMWPGFYAKYGDLSRHGNFERCLSALLAQKSIQRLEPDPDRIRREFWQGPAQYGRLFALFHEHHAARLNKRRWGDQCGPVIAYADAIFRAYPKAKMIHMIRDPRAVQTATNQLLGRRVGRVGVTAAKWLNSVRLMNRNVAHYPDGYRAIQYEQLVSEPKKTLTEICDFLGEGFSETMMDAKKTLRSKQFGNEHSENKDAATLTTDWEHAFLQTCMGPSMLALRYPIENPSALRRMRSVTHSWKWIASRICLSAWLCQQRASLPVKHALRAAQLSAQR